MWVVQNQCLYHMDMNSSTWSWLVASRGLYVPAWEWHTLHQLSLCLSWQQLGLGLTHKDRPGWLATETPSCRWQGWRYVCWCYHRLKLPKTLSRAGLITALRACCVPGKAAFCEWLAGCLWQTPCCMDCSSSWEDTAHEPQGLPDLWSQSLVYTAEMGWNQPGQVLQLYGGRRDEDQPEVDSKLIQDME